MRTVAFFGRVGSGKSELVNALLFHRFEQIAPSKYSHTLTTGVPTTYCSGVADDNSYYLVGPGGITRCDKPEEVHDLLASQYISRRPPPSLMVCSKKFEQTLGVATQFLDLPGFAPGGSTRILENVDTVIYCGDPLDAHDSLFANGFTPRDGRKQVIIFYTKDSSAIKEDPFTVLFNGEHEDFTVHAVKAGKILQVLDYLEETKDLVTAVEEPPTTPNDVKRPRAFSQSPPKAPRKPPRRA